MYSRQPVLRRTIEFFQEAKTIRKSSSKTLISLTISCDFNKSYYNFIINNFFLFSFCFCKKKKLKNDERGHYTPSYLTRNTAKLQNTRPLISNYDYSLLLKIELRISDFQHFHWLTRHRISVHIPTLPIMVKQ